MAARCGVEVCMESGLLRSIDDDQVRNFFGCATASVGTSLNNVEAERWNYNSVFMLNFILDRNGFFQKLRYARCL